MSTQASPPPLPAARRWGLILPIALFFTLALSWSVFWYYAASQAEAEIAAWRFREAEAGRIYNCAEQSIGGYPFRIEVRCASLKVEIHGLKPPLALQMRDALVVAQIYQPTFVIGEFTGPLLFAQFGRTSDWRLDWAEAKTSIRGLSFSPERVSLVFEKPVLSYLTTSHMQPFATADHLELHAREARRLPEEEPAADLALTVANARLPGLEKIPAQPINAEIVVSLRGLKDLAPSPLAQRLHDWQTSKGRLEITRARIRQGDILIDGIGSLSLSPGGKVNGEIQLTVAGLEQLITLLGLDEAIREASQTALDRLAPGLRLDRVLAPRSHAALAATGIGMFGKVAEIEGRRAVALPLRFVEGVAFLGPLRIGEVPALF